MLRQTLGDVTVTLFTLEADSDRWQPVGGVDQTAQEDGFTVNSPALLHVLSGQEPIFFGHSLSPGLDLGALAPAGAGALYPCVQENETCGLLRVTLADGQDWNEAGQATFRTVAGALGLGLRHCATRK